MNFVAIDFETANEKRNSPCSLGLTVVENNKIVLEKYWLIRPHEMRFMPINIMIHGIHPQDVANEPTFDLLWPEIAPYLEGKLVVAHNASFDLSVLRHTLDLYGLPYPSFDYCCTMVMTKHFYPQLENAKLNTVSSFLGYEFSHHHASADASASANILLEIMKELEVTTLEALKEQIGLCPGKLYPSGYKPASSTGGRISKRSPLKTYCAEISPTHHAFKDEIVAFTGPLNSMTRMKAIQLVEATGGSYSSSVTRKTTLVVTNVQNPYILSEEQMSTKLRRAMTLIKSGQSITFLDEKAFLERLN